MQVTLFTNNITFSGNTAKFRKDYSKRIDAGRLTEVNIANIQGLADRFAEEGLDYTKCLELSKQHPFLLVQKPDTMEYNIREAAKRFKKEGLTTEQYLKSALHYPNLFSCSPDTIEKNIRSTVKLFENYGLSAEKYLHCALDNASIFTTKPETIKRKVYTISNKLNISTSDILNAFLKQPTLFGISEKEIIKRYGILKYIEENKFLDKQSVSPSEKELSQSILRKKLTNKKEYLYTYLLRNKISSTLEWGHKIPHDDIIGGTLNFIKENKDKVIRINILDGKYAKDFTKFVKNLSKATVRKNIFRITII